MNTDPSHHHLPWTNMRPLVRLKQIPPPPSSLLAALYKENSKLARSPSFITYCKETWGATSRVRFSTSFWLSSKVAICCVLFFLCGFLSKKLRDGSPFVILMSKTHFDLGLVSSVYPFHPHVLSNISNFFHYRPLISFLLVAFYINSKSQLTS